MLRRPIRPSFLTMLVFAACVTCGCRSVPEAIRSTDGEDILRVPDHPSLPKTWRPTRELQAQLDAAPWTDAEEQATRSAVWVAVEEMRRFFEEHPEQVEAQGVNAIEPFLDTSYGAGLEPELVEEVRAIARQHLLRQAEALKDLDPAELDCEHFASLLPLAAYARTLLPVGDATRERLVALTCSSLARCSSFSEAMGLDAAAVLGAKVISCDELYELVLWSVSILDAKTIENLRLPPESDEVVRQVWSGLARYPFEPARVFPERANDETFYANAYLATHAGYVPTGYGRHPLYVEDARWLYRFLRENFYDVLEMGELDLLAEFVDLLRQYGCTPVDDVMVRDGTRYLMALFHRAGDSWIDHREPYEVETPDPYDLLHKPWTAISGIRHRIPEPPIPGSYGAGFRALLAEKGGGPDSPEPAKGEAVHCGAHDGP